MQVPSKRRQIIAQFSLLLNSKYLPCSDQKVLFLQWTDLLLELLLTQGREFVKILILFPRYRFKHEPTLFSWQPMRLEIFFLIKNQHRWGLYFLSCRMHLKHLCLQLAVGAEPAHNAFKPSVCIGKWVFTWLMTLKAFAAQSAEAGSAEVV